MVNFVLWDSVGLGQGLKFCISYKLPSNADTVAQGLHWKKQGFKVHRDYLDGFFMPISEMVIQHV